MLHFSLRYFIKRGKLINNRIKFNDLDYLKKRNQLRKDVGNCFTNIFFLACFSVILITCRKDIISDPSVSGVQQDVYTNGSAIKYWDNGDHKKRMNIVFIGDGFALNDQVIWKAHVDNMLNALFSSTLGEPFGRYAKFFNVYRIDMISKHSGLDEQNRTTPLRGMSGCYDLAVEDCYVDFSLTRNAIDYYMSRFGNPDIALREVALNSSLHYGNVHWPSWGHFATYSAWNANTVNIFIHENGHMAGFLADEYVTDANATYSDNVTEFWKQYNDSLPNVTRILNPLKWALWVGFDQPYQGNRSSRIGAYEGGLYVGKGIFRPSENCMMNFYKDPFCAVCREKIILDFYRKVRPVDSVIISIPVISVDLVDPDLFKIVWLVDENEVAASVLSLDLSTLGLSSGEHAVRIEVSDKILEYSYTGTYFDWVRKDTNLLKQTIIKHVIL